MAIKPQTHSRETHEERKQERGTTTTQLSEKDRERATLRDGTTCREVADRIGKF